MAYLDVSRIASWHAHVYFDAGYSVLRELRERPLRRADPCALADRGINNRESGYAGGPARRGLADNILIGRFHRGCGFLTLPAKFAGPAVPHRQLQIYLEGVATWVGCSESILDHPLYHVSAATIGAMVIVHHKLLPSRRTYKAS